MTEKNQPVVGQIFYVPLYEGGYAFGYVTVIDKYSGKMCNFFDLVSETPEVPADIATTPVILYDLLVGGSEFVRHRAIADKQWKVTSCHMPGEVRPKNPFFIMHSRPVYQLVDLTREQPKRPATDEEIARYPVLGSFFPPFTTKIVEKAVRHLDIDTKLIGVDRAPGTVH